MTMPDVSLPLLRGARVCLRAQSAADVPALFSLHADPAVMRFWSCAPFSTIAQAQALFEKNARGARAGEFFGWAIADAGDTLIGTCSLFGIDAANRRATIGYALARRAWGNGYATEALHLALAHAFGAVRLNRVEADVDPRNVASTRLLERVGFSREGVLRERWHVGAEVQDSAVYGLLAREYTPMAPAGGEPSRAGASA